MLETTNSFSDQAGLAPCPTLILRHRKENLKKCSLRGLEVRTDFEFFTYPMASPPPRSFSDYILLDIEGSPLTKADRSRPLFLIDATWRYAKKMQQFVESFGPLEKRSLPGGFQTAYPRCQEDCPDPEAGLASIEALYIAFYILGYPTEHLLDHYYWKEAFLAQNQARFAGLK